MTDYPYIRAWGWLMGSYDYYIREQVARARAVNAPERAIYERSLAAGKPSGKWAIVDEIADPQRRAQVEAYAKHGRHATSEQVYAELEAISG